MKISSIKRIVNKALDGYSNKPKVSYLSDGPPEPNMVVLRGGHWAAREDVEKALRRHTDAVQNRPTGKTIYLK